MEAMFPIEGIRDGNYQRIVGTNYGEIGEYGELSERKGHAKDHRLDLGKQETIPHYGVCPLYL